MSQSLPYDPVRAASPRPEKFEFIDNPDYSDQAHHVNRATRWIPIPLRAWFAIPTIVLMILGAVAIEIAFHYSQKNKGWNVSNLNLAFGAAHSVYTLPPVAIAMVIIAIWAWTDFEFKRLQPFVDLSHGNAPAEKSILLDYITINKFLVWIPALRNQHWATVLSTIVSLVSLIIQPLSANFFVIRDTMFTYPDFSVINHNVVGLNPDYTTITPFVTAAGYAEAAALYNLTDPPFIKGGWTIAPFDIPTNFGLNGTIIVNTTGILTTSHCDFADTTQFARDAGNDGWVFNGTWTGCFATVNVDTNLTTQYGVTPVQTDCPANLANLPNQFKPVMFWIFTADPTAANGVKYDSMTFCQPTLEMYEVEATVDLATGSLLDTKVMSNFTGTNNVTGDPINGQALNGINFDLTGADKYTIARAGATQSGLPSAIYQVALSGPGGLNTIYSNGDAGFVNLTDRVYTQFLALAAKNVYFLDAPEPTSAIVNAIEPRVWITPYVAHTIAVILLFIAIFGTLAHLISLRDRRTLYLRTEPGTLGQAASMVANSELAGLMKGHEDERGIRDAVTGKRFGIDRTTGVIMVD